MNLENIISTNFYAIILVACSLFINILTIFFQNNFSVKWKLVYKKKKIKNSVGYKHTSTVVEHHHQMALVAENAVLFKKNRSYM